MVLIVMPHGIGRAHGRRAAPCRGGAGAGRRSLFITILRPALRNRAVAQNVVFLLSSVLFAGTVLAQTPPAATPESAQVTEAFGELDALSATIAGRLRDLAQPTGLPAPPPAPEPTPPPAGPDLPASPSGATGAPPSPPSESGDGGGTRIQSPEPESCGTRKDMDLRIANVEERFDGFRQTINAANDDLPTHRDDVRDINKVCTSQVEGNIASAVNRLDRLQIEPTYDVAVELLACVDQRRRTIDGELNRSDITTIRIRILTDELDRLTDTTHRVQDMEQVLLRAVSKRRRLVEELTQFSQEIASACAT